MRRLIPTAVLLCLASCAAAPTRPAAPAVSLPTLGLSPAAFGEAVSLAQRLSFAHDADPEGPRTLEALLEIDASALRLAGFVLHRRVFTMQWDGTALEEQRDPHLPAQFQSRQVLRDVQLVYWPAEALRSALPPGWTLEETPGRRVLLEAGREWVTVHYESEPRWAGRAELLNLAEHYRLTIESRPVEG